MFAHQLVSRVITAEERYLDNCLTPDLPLVNQVNRLENLIELARELQPPEQHKVDRAFPQDEVFSFQLSDLDNDNADELILNMRLFNRDINPFMARSDSGYITIIFDLAPKTRTWHGTLVWPHSTKISALDWYPVRTLVPLIYPLKFETAQKSAFVLVTGETGFADRHERWLEVWRFNDGYLEPVSWIQLDGWCGYPNWDEWQITEAGILTPASPGIPWGNSSTSWRCEAREAVLYALENGKFVKRKP